MSVAVEKNGIEGASLRSHQQNENVPPNNTTRVPINQRVMKIATVALVALAVCIAAVYFLPPLIAGVVGLITGLSSLYALSRIISGKSPVLKKEGENLPQAASVSSLSIEVRNSEEDSIFEEGLEVFLKDATIMGNKTDAVRLIREAAKQNAKTLDISSLRLTRLPSSIWTLTQLEELSVRNNSLTDMPIEIGELKNLKQLDLGYNEFRTLPLQIENLNLLEILLVSNNKLTSLPDGIVKLIHLKQLYLKCNNLSALPPSIGSLTILRTLDIQNNKLSGLPDEFGNLVELRVLDLQKNCLLNLPSSIGNLKELFHLDLADNSRLSRLPNSLENLSKLTTIRAQGTGITKQAVNEIFIAIDRKRSLFPSE